MSDKITIGCVSPEQKSGLPVVCSAPRFSDKRKKLCLIRNPLPFKNETLSDKYFDGGSGSVFPVGGHEYTSNLPIQSDNEFESIMTVQGNTVTVKYAGASWIMEDGEKKRFDPSLGQPTYDQCVVARFDTYLGMETGTKKPSRVGIDFSFNAQMGNDWCYPWEKVLSPLGTTEASMNRFSTRSKHLYIRCVVSGSVLEGKSFLKGSAIELFKNQYVSQKYVNGQWVESESWNNEKLKPSASDTLALDWYFTRVNVKFLLRGPIPFTATARVFRIDS